MARKPFRARANIKLIHRILQKDQWDLKSVNLIINRKFSTHLDLVNTMSTTLYYIEGKNLKSVNRKDNHYNK